MSSKPVALRRARARAAPVAVGLTREAVIMAALELVDRHGLARFSIRNLARSLGVNPTVIAWHLGNLNMVLAEVVAAVQRDLVVPMRDGEHWQDWLRGLFTRYREAIRAHPNVAPLIGAELVSNARVDLALVERILEALTTAGFKGRALRDAYSTVIAAMTGFTTQEFAPLPDERALEWQDEMQSRLDGAHATEYPLLAGNLPLLVNQSFIVRWKSGGEAPLGDGFAMFVDCVIAGLEAMAGRPMA